jgi:hypothetical protein
VSLTACSNCWDEACICSDGHGWRGYARASLLDIRASIDAALAAGPRVEVVTKPTGPVDYGATITINARDIEP